MKRIFSKFFCNNITNNLKKNDLTNKLKDIPDIKTFMSLNKDNNLSNNNFSSLLNTESYFESNIHTPFNFETSELEKQSYFKKPKTFFIETYGCQMNESDSEIISSILIKSNFEKIENIEDADIVLANTCAVRESAEEKVWHNIQHYKGIKRRDKTKIFGILGCMAERMKEKILERSNNVIDIIVGPDAYRDLPNMIDIISKKDDSESRFAMNVQLSLEETYADIMPVRRSQDNVKAYLSIMRGCNNMCSFCIVPFTRGRERSRDFNSIIDEVKMLRDNGVKEITLLGQNVNSYIDETFNGNSEENNNNNNINLKTINSEHENSPGFRELYKLRYKKGLRFAELIDKVSQVAPEVRFRFTSPHPKDFPTSLIDVIKSNHNICKQIHLPVQSGNSKVLKDMRRYYTREAYLDLVNEIRSKIPLVGLSSDFISGFCGETDEEFQDTISLLEIVKYDMAFLFAYSMREKTHAFHNLKDDVSFEIKKRRLAEMIDVFRHNSLEVNKKEIGSYHIVLIENVHKKNKNKFVGRSDTNKLIMFDSIKVPSNLPKSLKNHEMNIFNNNSQSDKEEMKVGDYVLVKIDEVSTNSLYGSAISKIKRMSDFFILSKGHPYIINN